MTTDDEAATWRGARRHTRPAATIHAVSIALERLASARRGDNAAVTIRVAHSECRLIAGMDIPTSENLDVLDEMRRRWYDGGAPLPACDAFFSLNGTPSNCQTATLGTSGDCGRPR